MDINYNFIRIYKIISRIFLRLLFPYEHNLIKNYILPVSIVDKYYFLYPCYKEALTKLLPNIEVDTFKKKSICLNKNFKKINKFYIQKKAEKSIFIIGNNLNKINLDLYKNSIILGKKLNINKIFYKEHPRSKLNLSNYTEKNFPIIKHNKELEIIDQNTIIVTSYSSLTPYFLTRGFKILLCKDSILLELKSPQKLDLYLKIYEETYSKSQFISI